MSLFKKLFGSSEPKEPRPAAKSRRILLAETSITIAKVIELALPESTITTVTSIADARAALAQRPDVVITGLTLQDGDGYALCSAAKEHGLPVILLRGAFEPFEEAKARINGADAIVPKPFRPEELIAAIERVAT